MRKNNILSTETKFGTTQVDNIHSTAIGILGTNTDIYRLDRKKSGSALFYSSLITVEGFTIVKILSLILIIIGTTLLPD